MKNKIKNVRMKILHQMRNNLQETLITKKIAMEERVGWILVVRMTQSGNSIMQLRL